MSEVFDILVLYKFDYYYYKITDRFSSRQLRERFGIDDIITVIQ